MIVAYGKSRLMTDLGSTLQFRRGKSLVAYYKAETADKVEMAGGGVGDELD